MTATCMFGCTSNNDETHYSIGKKYRYRVWGDGVALCTVVIPRENHQWVKLTLPFLPCEKSVCENGPSCKKAPLYET